jgi:hypothetical protein
MKGLTIISFILLASLAGFSQTTYYWVGGVGPAAFHGTSANWNTALNGSGTARSTPLANDILVFDGSNIGGATPTTGTVNATATTHSFGQLILQNGADVIVQRITGGTGNLTIAGDGLASNDLSIAAGSSLKITSSIASSGLTITLATGATGTIAGNLLIMDAGVFTARFYVKDANALNFASGSKCYVNNQVAGDNPFGASATPVATGGINFKSGSELIYQGGINPYSSSTFIPFYFEAGSTFILEANNVANMFVGHTFSNVIVRNNAIITLTENFYNIDTLTINNGCTFNTRITGTNPIAGNIVNNGTFGATTGFSTAHLILDGIVPQSIGGPGVFNDVGTFSVATDADVTLNTNISIGGTSTSTISGKLNTQTYTLNGTGDFQLRTAAAATSNGTLTSGSNTVALDPTVFTTGINTANVSAGAHVTGTGIQNNTYIIATNSAASTFTLSKPATITTGPLAASITITNTPATLATTNAGGVDGSITTSGVRSFGTGTNYIFNASTTAPFTSSSANVTGNVTFNATATTNKTSQSIGGTLTLNAGKLTIRNTDLLRITSGNAIGGAPFSSSKYIISEVAGNNLGVLRIDNLPITTTLFPVGTANYYLPVSLTPASTVDHAVSVYQGVTEDGTPTGTAFTAAKKANVVDAVWIINRPTGTGDCIMQLQWNAALEGSAFAAYANSRMGISRHDGTTWGICLGTGDNSANTATALYSNFSPFGVGYNGALLAAQIKNISALIRSNAVEINWYVANEAGTQRYEIEKSLNKIDFFKIDSVNATGKEKYAFTDAAAISGVVYYRIKMIGISGDIKYSEIVSVKPGHTNEISIFPNPVTSYININIPDLQGLLTLQLINMEGKIIFTGPGSLLQVNGELNRLLPSLQHGVYRVRINNAENIYQGKFIKM